MPSEFSKEHFLAEYAGKSNVELMQIVRRGDGYLPEAVDAAEELISQRSVSLADRQQVVYMDAVEEETSYYRNHFVDLTLLQKIYLFLPPGYNYIYYLGLKSRHEEEGYELLITRARHYCQVSYVTYFLVIVVLGITGSIALAAAVFYAAIVYLWYNDRKEAAKRKVLHDKRYGNNPPTV